MSRKDFRSDQEFKKDIKDFTVREQYLMHLFFQECQFRGNPIEYFPNGVCNEGEYVAKSNSNPDFVCYSNNRTKFYIEVKLASVKGFATFKVRDIENYLKYGDTYMLLFLNYGDNKVGRTTEDIAHNWYNLRWCVVSPNRQKRMIEELKHFPFRGMGNKLCVRVKEDQYEEYFGEVRELAHLTGRH